MRKQQKSSNGTGKSRVTLFNPDTMPFQGIATYPAAVTLPLGTWVTADNLRHDTSALVVRNGSTLLSTSAPGTAFRGCYNAGRIGGAANDVLLFAWRISSETRVYSMNPSTGAMTEITGSSGNQYGNTRFPTDGNLQFALIRDNSTPLGSADFVVMSNGADPPLIYNGSSPLGIVHEIALPSGVGTDNDAAKSVATFPRYALMSGASVPTLAESTAARFEGTMNGTTPNNHPRLTIKAAIANGDTVTMTLAASTNLTGSQIVFIYRSGVATVKQDRDTRDTQAVGSEQEEFTPSASFWSNEFWDNIKVELKDGTTWSTLYDPTSTKSHKVIAPVHPSGKDKGITYQIGFTTNAFGTATNIAAITDVRFTWVGTTRPAGSPQYFVDLFMLAAGGAVRGRAQYGATYCDELARCESPGIILKTQDSARIDTLGGPLLNGLKIANDFGFLYDYKIYIQNHDNFPSVSGADTIYLYRRDYGETRFTRLDTKYTIAVYSAPWAWSSGSAGSLITLTDTARSEQKDPDAVLPDKFHKTIPKAAALISVGNRLLAGRLAANLGNVWASEDKQPMRFRPIVKRGFAGEQFDLASATSFTLNGEQVTAFAQLSGAYGGSNTVYIFTAKKLYAVSAEDALSLTRPRYVAPYGTLSARSVVEYLGMLFWVDQQGQLRKLDSSGISTPSFKTVEDQFATSADITVTAGIVFKDILRMAYRPSAGSTNAKAITLDLRSNVLARDAYASPVTAEAYLVNNVSNVERLLAVGSNGRVYILEDSAATDDAGSAITVTLTTGEIHSGDVWQPTFFGRVGVLQQDQSGKSWTVTRTGKPVTTSGYPTGSISVDGADSYAWFWETQSTSYAQPGITAVTGQYSMTAAMPPGTVILSIVCEIGRRGPGTGASGTE